MPRYISDDDFIAAWKRLGTPTAVGKALELTPRHVYARRRAIEMTHGIALPSKVRSHAGSINSAAGERADKVAAARAEKYEGEMHDAITDGMVMVASDCHYWPGIVTEAHQAFCRLVAQLKPAMVVLNGDIFDGARISRHPRIMWEQQPQLKDEIHAMQDRCAEIERAAGAEIGRAHV